METFNIKAFKNNSNIKIMKVSNSPREVVISQDSDRLCLLEPQAVKLVHILTALYPNAKVGSKRIPSKLLEAIGASHLVDSDD